MQDEAVVTVEWLGHAAFVLSFGQLRVVTDPFPPTMGYPAIHQAAEVVTVSHEHFDHNHVQSVTGATRVLRGLSGNDWNVIDQQISGVRIRSFPTYHDEQLGRARGKNAVFTFEFGGLRVVHLGDLGHPLGAAPGTATADQIGPADVLLVPVGGFYTIDARLAHQVANSLRARVVIPMHYRTPALAGWPIETEQPFLRLRPASRELSGPASLSAAQLPPAPETWVFAYRGSRS